MATKNTTKTATPEQATAPVDVKPTEENVTAIVCALLHSPRYNPQLKDESHQDHLIGVAYSLASKIAAKVR